MYHPWYQMLRNSVVSTIQISGVKVDAPMFSIHHELVASQIAMWEMIDFIQNGAWFSLLSVPLFCDFL